MKNNNQAPQELRKRTPPNYGRVLFLIFMVATLSVLMATPAFAAEADIWDKAKEVLGNVYTQIATISTIAGVATAAVALLLINFSKTERTVTEARMWLKRIIVAYILINSMGFIMAYITPFLAGGKYVS